MTLSACRTPAYHDGMWYQRLFPLVPDLRSKSSLYTLPGRRSSIRAGNTSACTTPPFRGAEFDLGAGDDSAVVLFGLVLAGFTLVLSDDSFATTGLAISIMLNCNVRAKVCLLVLTSFSLFSVAKLSKPASRRPGVLCPPFFR